MILITSASYLPSEFQAEFGKIVPSFLAFGGKRLYEYQANLFKFARENNEKIVLSLPQSFRVSDFEREKMENLGISLLFVPDKLSLGESINYCLNMNLPQNEPLQILHGDTYFMDFAPFSGESCDMLGISTTLYNYDWANVENFSEFGGESNSRGFFADSSVYASLNASNTDFPPPQRLR